jgi:hypothetical protein
MAGEFKFSTWKVFKLPNKFLELIIHPLRVGWRNFFPFFPLSEKGSSSPLTIYVCSARIRLVKHVKNK